MRDILKSARQAHRDYHSGQLSLEQLQSLRLQFESQLQTFLDNPPLKGWPADAQRLRQRLYKHWFDWFTFLSHPEVKPDNNDAERALRPVVVHRLRQRYRSYVIGVASLLPRCLVFF